MRIYTKGSELAHKSFTFPDGQPHWELLTEDDGGFKEVTIETAIRNPKELFEVLLAEGVLRGLGYCCNLDVRYLMGARMDRAIDPHQPFTLATVARLINGAGFGRVRVLDAHSEATTRLLRGSVNVLPLVALRQVKASLRGYTSFVCPDKGAVARTQALCSPGPIYYCEKTRDPQTGALTGFKVNVTPVYGDVLIVDDICDGGGTFVGLAKELRKAGAKTVSLFVTHLIASKGLPLEGIDKVFTTDSYHDRIDSIKNSQHRPFENRSSNLLEEVATVIPVSMREI